MAILSILLLLPVELLLLGVGGYALYEGFSKEEGDRIWLGSPQTARIIGVVAVLGGVLILCGIVFFFAFMYFGVSISP